MARSRPSLLRLATAPARLALRQTRTNIAALQALRRDASAWLPILEQAADETIENIVTTLAAAEQSLPAGIENMTPSERRSAVTESLARSERLLLAAMGELYRSWRLMSAEQQRQLIENPPQSSFRD
ncbi:MAG: hypothetical protein V2J89_04850 [Halieaceae bacterium]|jgi:hypothetical protein|nr:hypothetical protein [Halieaceae bacterium]